MNMGDIDIWNYFPVVRQKPVIAHSESNVLPTGEDSAKTPRIEPAEFKTERREAQALEIEGLPALASVWLPRME